jgi:hypothetical protein
MARSAFDDDLGAFPRRDGADLVVVDELVRLAHSVGDHVEQLAREVDRRTVREMSPMGQLHPHESVAGGEKGEVGRRIRLRPRMRLHVDVLGPEDLCGALDRQVFDDVDVLTTAVVAASRISLCVLIGERRAQRGEDRRRGEVLGGDQLDLGVLAMDLGEDRLGRCGIDLCQRGPVRPTRITHSNPPFARPARTALVRSRRSA